MIKQSLDEWKEEGKKLFGDIKNWKFKCPVCGHVSSVKDFINLGEDGNDAYNDCIGRVNGKGMSGLSNGKDNSNGCDWAAYGFLGTLGKGRIVVMENGKEVEIFDFAK